MALRVDATVNIGSTPFVVPGGLDATGATDVTTQLQGFLNTLVANGATVDFAGGLYRLNGTVKLTSRHDITLQNGHFFTDYVDPAGTITAQDYYVSLDAGTWPTSKPYQNKFAFNFVTCTGMTVDGMTWRGPNPCENLYNPLGPWNAPQVGSAGKHGRDAYQANLEAQHFVNLAGGDRNTVKNCAASDFFGDFVSVQPGPGTFGNLPPATNTLIQDCLMFNSGRMGISVVHADQTTIRRVTAYNMRRTTIDLEPTDDTEYVTNVEIDALSYGTHVAGFLVVSGYSVSSTISDINVHDCSDNSLGNIYGTATFDVQVNGQLFLGTWSKQRWTLTNNTCSTPFTGASAGQTGLPSVQMNFVQGVTLHNNVLTDAGNSIGVTAKLGSCTGVVDLGGNLTVPSGNPIQQNWRSDVATLALSTGITDPVPGGNRRNPVRQPFASTSIWNTAVGSSATLAAVTLPAGQQTTLDTAFFVVATAADPVTSQYAAQTGLGYCGSPYVPAWNGYTDPYAAHPPVNVCDTSVYPGGAPIAGQVVDGYTVGAADRFLAARRIHNQSDSVGIYNVTPPVLPETHKTPTDCTFDGCYYVGTGIRVLNGTANSGAWVTTSLTAPIAGPHAGDASIYYAGDQVSGIGRTQQTVEHWAPTTVGGVVDTPRLPSALLIPDKDTVNAPTYTNALTVLQPDGITLKQYVHAARCQTSAALYGDKAADGDITLDGIAGPRSSGLSGLGGTLNLDDVRSTVPIRHALAVSMSPGRLSPSGGGFTWPATAANTAGFASANAAMKLGALLVIPSGTSEGSLGLSTSLGSKLFFALQNYGAYIVDVGLGYQLAARFDAHKYVHDSYGTLVPGSGLGSDINKLLAACQAVTNNTSGSVGGGGTPAQPTADPLG